MASSAEARQLTETHRLAQARIGAAATAQLLNLWTLVDADDLDGSFPLWARAAVPVVQQHRSLSAQLAVRYVARFRALELGDVAPFLPVPETTVNPAALLTSLHVTGPVTVKRALTNGADLSAAMRLGQAESAGAGMRHAIDGGRATVNTAVDTDERALGWQRATRVTGKPCYFCALMASRGPVYKTEGTASFKPHDRCHCTPEPVYREDTEWTPRAREYADLYAQAAKGSSDPLNAFRRAYEST